MNCIAGYSFFDPTPDTVVYSIKYLTGALFLISSFSKPPYRKHKSNHPKTHQVDSLFKIFTSPSLLIRYYLNYLDWNVRPLTICPCSSFPSLFTLSYNSSVLKLYLLQHRAPYLLLLNGPC